jgi:fatty-acyl-CoA synthase
LVEDWFSGLLAATDHPLSSAVTNMGALLGASRRDLTFDFVDDLAFVQHSSGSTGRPSGVLLSSAAIAAQIETLGAALRIDPERDRGVTWLPMSHDMGLFGSLLLAWAAGIPGLCSRPERFLASPVSWLEDCAAFGATLTSTPPFGLTLAAKSAIKAEFTGSLASVRICTLGGDHVDSDQLRSALDALMRYQLSPASVTPAYGLAEATLAVTVSDIDREPLVRPISGGPWFGDRTLVSSGRPLPDTKVRIAEDGEIIVSSPSLGSGYLNNQERSAARLRDGELYTGDLGVVDNGELFVTGRKDDLLIVGGRNISAAPIEAELGRLPELRPGACMIVDTRGPQSERIFLLAEVRDPAIDLKAVAVSLRKRSLSISGLRLDACVFLERDQMPRTPTGKPQRYRGREIVASGGGHLVTVA